MRKRKPKFQRNRRVFVDVCKSQFLLLPAIGFTNTEGTGFRIAFGWLHLLLSIRICREIGLSEEINVELFDDLDESFEV